MPLALVLILAGCQKHEHEQKKPTEADTAAPDKAVDPVCGMTVSKTGTDFHFCSAGCKAKFEADPRIYAMGFCGCKKGGPAHDCLHCKAIQAGEEPAVACGCGKS